MRYTIFYFACGVAAALTHAFMRQTATAQSAHLRRLAITVLRRSAAHPECGSHAAALIHVTKSGSMAAALQILAVCAARNANATGVLRADSV